MSGPRFIWRAWQAHWVLSCHVLVIMVLFGVDEYSRADWNGILAVLCLGTMCFAVLILSGTYKVASDLQDKVITEQNKVIKFLYNK